MDGRRPEVELVLSNSFKVLSFASNTVDFTEWPGIQRFGVGGRQIDIVRIIFQTSSPHFRILAQKHTGHWCRCAPDGQYGQTSHRPHPRQKPFVLIRCGQTETVAVCFYFIVTIVLPRILRGKVQTFNQTEEIGVTVGGNAGEMLGHEYVKLRGPYRHRTLAERRSMRRCRKQRRSYDRSRKNRIQRISDQRMPDGFCLVGTFCDSVRLP